MFFWQVIRIFDFLSLSADSRYLQSEPLKYLAAIVFIHLFIFFNGILLFVYQAPVPGKPISANRGLNLANPGLKFILQLDSVPESTINTNPGINEGLNLIHLARSINSLIGGKT